MTAWLGWLLLGLGLLLLFVAWDLVFCGGERCGHIADRMPLRSLFERGRRGAGRRKP